MTFAAGRVQTIHHPPQHITGCAHDPAGGDPIIQPDPGAIIPEPSVVYDDIYAAAKNNGRKYDWWTVT